MRAVVFDRFGPSSVLDLRDISVPAITPDQILVEVYATSVNPIDWKIRDGLMSARYGSEFPQVLGFDASGVVVDTGDRVTAFRKGDEIFARSDNGAGKCYAEYVALNPGTVAPKPANLSHEAAAAMPLAALTPLIGLRDCGHVKANDHVLVIGASGGVGTYAVQVARLYGARVTAVCSTRNLALARELGADRVIDYTRDDPLGTDEPYDVIYDTIGSLQLDAARRALADNGVYMTLVPVPGIDFYLPGKSERVPRGGYFVPWAPTSADLRILGGWAEQGKLRSIIDSVFPLERMRQAHEHSQTLRARGKIVIRVRK